jgi:hypothetical protein
MNDSERSSPDYHLDRRTVLKVAAGASAAVVAPRAVSGAVLANNNEIVALSARAAADYIRRGELSANAMRRCCSNGTRPTPTSTP